MDKDKLDTRSNGEEGIKNKAQGKKPLQIAARIIAIVLCVVFGLTLLFNLVIIVKGLINPDVPPSVFGLTPLVVKTGSMSSDVQHIVQATELVDISAEQIKNLKPGDTVYTQYGDYKVENVIVAIQNPTADRPVFITERPAKDHIETGDLIFTVRKDVSEIEVGDIISYTETRSYLKTDSDGKITEQKTVSVVTHRVIAVTPDGFVTKGDANNTQDKDPIAPETVVGVFKSRVPALGDFLLFMQKPYGMAIFIGVPIIAFIVYDIIRRTKISKQEGEKTEELEAELERLRALAAAQEKELQSKNSASPEDGQN